DDGAAWFLDDRFVRSPGCASLTRATSRGRTCLPVQEARRGHVRTTVYPICSRCRAPDPAVSEHADRRLDSYAGRIPSLTSNPCPVRARGRRAFVARIRPKAASGDGVAAWFLDDARFVRGPGCASLTRATRAPTTNPLPLG